MNLIPDLASLGLKAGYYVNLMVNYVETFGVPNKALAPGALHPDAPQ